MNKRLWIPGEEGNIETVSPVPDLNDPLYTAAALRANQNESRNLYILGLIRQRELTLAERHLHYNPFFLEVESREFDHLHVIDFVVDLYNKLKPVFLKKLGVTKAKDEKEAKRLIYFLSHRLFQSGMAYKLGARTKEKAIWTPDMVIQSVRSSILHAIKSPSRIVFEAGKIAGTRVDDSLEDKYLVEKDPLSLLWGFGEGVERPLADFFKGHSPEDRAWVMSLTENEPQWATKLWKARSSETDCLLKDLIVEGLPGFLERNMDGIREHGDQLRKDIDDIVSGSDFKASDRQKIYDRLIDECLDVPEVSIGALEALSKKLQEEEGVDGEITAVEEEVDLEQQVFDLYINSYLDGKSFDESDSETQSLILSKLIETVRSLIHELKELWDSKKFATLDSPEFKIKASHVRIIIAFLNDSVSGENVSMIEELKMSIPPLNFSIIDGDWKAILERYIYPELREKSLPDLTESDWEKVFPIILNHAVIFAQEIKTIADGNDPDGFKNPDFRSKFLEIKLLLTLYKSLSPRPMPSAIIALMLLMTAYETDYEQLRADLRAYIL